MEGKNMGVIVILVLTIAVLGSSFFILKNRNLSDNLQDKDSKIDTSNSYQETDSPGFTPNNSEENITEEQIIEIVSGGGGGGSSGSSQSPQENCLGNQITYSMTGLIKTSVCNENQSDICLDKTVSCSIEVNNRDSETSGFFKLELTFSESGNQSNIVKKSNSEFFLGPGDTKIFSDSVNLQSTGEDGIANKDVNCFFNTLEVPRKVIC